MDDNYEKAKSVLAETKKKFTCTRLGEALGITRAAVSKWDIVPAHRLVEFSKKTGVPKQELRPDLYEGFEEVA